MVKIGVASECDYPEIMEMLDLSDIGHPSISPAGFWVARTGGRIAGIAKIEDCGECYYISAVGVRPECRKLGIARTLLDNVLRPLEKEAYLYSKIPDFFAKFGFAGPVSSPASIPPRQIYGCEKCGDEFTCICMVRPSSALKVSRL